MAWVRPKRSRLRRQRRCNGGDSGGADGLEASGTAESAAPASGGSGLAGTGSGGRRLGVLNRSVPPDVLSVSAVVWASALVWGEHQGKSRLAQASRPARPWLAPWGWARSAWRLAAWQDWLALLLAAISSVSLVALAGLTSRGWWARRVQAKRSQSLGEATHRCTVRSAEPLASRRPSGLNATDTTPPPWTLSRLVFGLLRHVCCRTEALSPTPQDLPGCGAWRPAPTPGPGPPERASWPGRYGSGSAGNAVKRRPSAGKLSLLSVCPAGIIARRLRGPGVPAQDLELSWLSPFRVPLSVAVACVPVHWRL